MSLSEDTILQKLMMPLKSATTSDGGVADAIIAVEALLQENPESALICFGLAYLAFLKNDKGGAIKLLERAHDLDPECREYVDAMACSLAHAGRLTDSLYFAKLSETMDGKKVIASLVDRDFLDYSRALQYGQVSAHIVDAMRALNAAKYEDCIDYCHKELRINPAHHDALSLLAQAFRVSGRYSQAVNAAEAAIELKPDVALNYVLIGDALMHLGQHHSAMVNYDRALRLAPDDVSIFSRIMAAVPKIDDDGELIPSYREKGQSVIDAITSAGAHHLEAAPRDRRVLQPGEKVRVGIVSDVLLHGEKGVYIESLIKFMNKDHFEVFIYNMLPKSDPVTTRIKTRSSSWREIFDLDDLTLMETLRRDSLDVFINACFRPEHAHLRAMVWGVAPVQLCWPGHSEVAGVPGVNMIIGDEWTEKSDAALALDGQVCRAKQGSVLSYDPTGKDEDALENLSLSGGPVIGVPADLSILKPNFVKTVAESVLELDDARIFIGCRPLLDHGVRKGITDMFSALGVGDRLVFQDLPTSDGQAMEEEAVWTDFFRSVDVFLDPFPVGDWQSVPLALWMGVPVVTMPGKWRASTNAASMLAASGHEDWIATDKKLYKQTIIDLSKDVQALRKGRNARHMKVLKSILFHPNHFTHTFSESLHGLFVK